MYSLEVVRWEVVEVVNNGHGGSQSHAHNQNFWMRKRPAVTDMPTPLRVAQDRERHVPYLGGWYPKPFCLASVLDIASQLRIGIVHAYV